MSLWLVSSLLILLVLLVLLKPLFARRSEPAGGDAQNDRRYELLGDRLGELERERATGLIGGDEYTQAKRETEAAYAACATEDAVHQRTPVAAIVAVLALVTAAAGSYFYYSEGYRIVLAEEHATSVMEEFEETQAVLAAHLAEQPQDNDARQLFATLKYRFGDYTAAAAEYRRVDESGALEDPVAWMNYADALLRSGGAVREAIQGTRVLAMLDKILVDAPGDRRALFLAGMLSFEREDYPRASEYWQSLLVVLPEEETEVREELQRLIARAQRDQTAPPEETTEDNVENGGAIIVTVSLAENLRAQAAPDDTVFVYARAIDGPLIPLAIVRLRVADLPAEVSLDEGDAMMADMSLAMFDRVEVIARVSKQGQATPAAGDLIGSVSPTAVGSRIEVLISKIVE